ncbi:MAG: class I SAM-dependent methyltransferase [Proteobacteria bacterium]|nr:class I SAM-dependent methyltransferase [Pseudomonadota bacterium]
MILKTGLKNVIGKIKKVDFVRRVAYLFINRKYYSSKQGDLRKEFFDICGGHGLQKLIDEYKFNTVLDLGSGEGIHSEILKQNGKKVTSLDYGLSPYFRKCQDTDSCVVGDFLKVDFSKQFDCIWCSHVLEHQQNSNEFLKKIYQSLKDKGVLAITVPPLKKEIVGGHVNLYNAGLLLYQLISAGFDCSDAKVLSYGYNITVIVNKKPIKEELKLTYDTDDMLILKKFFPFHLHKFIDKKGYFNGDIEKINW